MFRLSLEIFVDSHADCLRLQEELMRMGVHITRSDMRMEEPEMAYVNMEGRAIGRGYRGGVAQAPVHNHNHHAMLSEEAMLNEYQRDEILRGLIEEENKNKEKDFLEEKDMEL